MSEIDTLFVETAATAAGTSVIRKVPEARPTYASISRQAAALRDEVELTGNDVKQLHRETVQGALDERTALIGLREPMELIEELGSERGLSWSTLARLVGVTGTAIRKWRRGEQITPQNRRRLARAHAFVEMLTGPYPVGDPASWLEMPISDEASLTPIDLYAANRMDLLFEFAGRRMGAHAVLDAFDPEWRTGYVTDERFAVVQAPDGHPSIVERPQGA